LRAVPGICAQAAEQSYDSGAPASPRLEPDEIGSETSEGTDGENEADPEFAPSSERTSRHQEEDGRDRKAKLSCKYGNPQKRVSNTNKVMHVSAERPFLAITLNAGQPSRKRSLKWRGSISRIDKAANKDVDSAQYITAMSAATIHRQNL
jgi:hypothetical protein